jgi:hypothetical protein
MNSEASRPRRACGGAVLVVAAAVLAGSLAPRLAAPCVARPAHGETGRGAARSALPAYGILTTGFAQGDVWSPDLRYVASARIGEAAVLTLTVLDADTRKPLARIDDVEGFTWVPYRPHELVVAACGLYAKAFLGLWNGGRSWRSLHPVRHPENECFRLYGVSTDGHYIVYGYDPDMSRGEGPRDAVLRRRHWLRLPLSTGGRRVTVTSEGPRQQRRGPRQ